MKLHICTPYGTTYTVDEQGNFIQYKEHHFNPNNGHEWVMLGLLPVNCIHLYNIIPFNQINSEWIKNNPIRYKNGNPRYTVVDRDHGTIRVWGNTKVHAVKYLSFES